MQRPSAWDVPAIGIFEAQGHYMMTRYGPTFEDGRGRFPDRISAPALRGMRADIRRAASLTGTTAASFIRDAIDRHVRAVLSEAQPNV